MAASHHASYRESLPFFHIPSAFVGRIELTQSCKILKARPAICQVTFAIPWNALCATGYKSVRVCVSCNCRQYGVVSHMRMVTGETQEFWREECRISSPSYHMCSCKFVLTSLVEEKIFFVRVQHIESGP